MEKKPWPSSDFFGRLRQMATVLRQRAGADPVPETPPLKTPSPNIMDISFLDRIFSIYDQYDVLLGVQLICFVLSTIYRMFLTQFPVMQKNVFFIMTGLALMYFKYPLLYQHLIAVALLNFTLLYFRKVDQATVFLSFLVNLGYPAIVQRFVPMEPNTLFWALTNTQFILKAIACALELFELEKNRDKKRLENTPNPTTASNLSFDRDGGDAFLEAMTFRNALWFFGYMFYPFALSGGPNISFNTYQNFVSNRSRKLDRVCSNTKVPAFVRGAFKKLVMAVFYLAIYKISGRYINWDFFGSSFYLTSSPFVQVFLHFCGAKIFLIKYMSLWLMAEACGIMAGAIIPGLTSESRSNIASKSSFCSDTISPKGCVNPVSFHRQIADVGGSSYKMINNIASKLAPEDSHCLREVIENVFLFVLFGCQRWTVVLLLNKTFLMQAENAAHQLTKIQPTTNYITQNYRQSTNFLTGIVTNIFIGYFFTPLFLTQNDFETFYELSQKYFFAGHALYGILILGGVVNEIYRLSSGQTHTIDAEKIEIKLREILDETPELRRDYFEENLKPVEKITCGKESFLTFDEIEKVIARMDRLQTDMKTEKEVNLINWNEELNVDEEEIPKKLSEDKIEVVKECLDEAIDGKVEASDGSTKNDPLSIMKKSKSDDPNIANRGNATSKIENSQSVMDDYLRSKFPVQIVNAGDQPTEVNQSVKVVETPENLTFRREYNPNNVNEDAEKTKQQLNQTRQQLQTLLEQFFSFHYPNKTDLHSDIEYFYQLINAKRDADLKLDSKTNELRDYFERQFPAFSDTRLERDVYVTFLTDLRRESLADLDAAKIINVFDGVLRGKI